MTQVKLMSYILLSLVFLEIQANPTSQRAEIFQLIAQKTVIDNQPYMAILRTNTMSQATDVVVQFRDESHLMQVTRSSYDMKIFDFESAGKKFGNNKNFDLKTIVHRNGMCSRNVVNIERVIKRGFVFIQTDKAIYKPGDETQYRVVLLNPSLQPKMFNRLQVQLIPPKGSPFNLTIDLESQKVGLYEDKYTLPDEPELGEWKIHATINGKVHALKKFKVEKYQLPLYELYVSAPPKIALTSGKIPVMIEAKYSFGGFVAGTATVKFYKENSLMAQKQLSFNTQWSFELDIRNDLYIYQLAYNPTPAKIVVTFADSHGIETKTKEIPINFHSQRECSIIVKHLPQMRNDVEDYTFDVIVEDFDGNIVTNSVEKITATVNFVDSSSATRSKVATATIKNGIASLTFNNLLFAVSKTIDIEYNTCKRKGLTISDTKLMDILHVKHSPTSPKLSDTVTINVFHRNVLRKGFYIIMNRFGIVETKSLDCKLKNECFFTFKANKKMLPKSTVWVYEILNDKDLLIGGSTTIDFEDLSQNYVNLTLKDAKVKPKANFQMDIKSKKDSTVSLLAIDKRVTFLATGNDFDRDSIAKPFTEYKPDLHYVENDLKAFVPCTTGELALIQNLKQKPKTGNIFNNFIDIMKTSATIKDSNHPEDESTNAQREIDASNVREYFPETWIFETIDMKQGDVFSFQKKVPDSITSWIITAFSMHPTHGFALTKPVELIVSQEFFMKLSVPSYIKVGEVVKVNVIVFNYLESQNSITGSVTLNVKQEDNYRIVDKTSGGSTCIISLSPSLTKTVQFSANYRQSMMLTFNVQAISIGALTLRFTAVSGSHSDEIHRKITVEPLGIRKTITKVNQKDFKTHNSFSIIREQKCVTADVEVFGSFFSKRSLLNYDAERVQPDGCGEQAASIFIRSVLIFNYLKSKNALNYYELQNIPSELKSLFNHMNTNKFHSDGSYDLWAASSSDVWYTASRGKTTSIWLTAYVIRIITQAMSSGVIGNDYWMLKSSLNYLSSKKQSNGNGYYFTNDGYSKDPYTPFYTNSNMYTTSFVLLSFLYFEKIYGTSSYGYIVDSGMNYLDGYYSQVNAYPAALACYVFALRDAKNVREKLSNLESLYSHYSGSDQYYSDNGHSTSDFVTILTSSYVALAYMKLGMHYKAHPIIGFLHGVRKYSGYYNEGHDSAMALYAITEYAKHETSFVPGFSVSIASPSHATRSFTINRENLDGFVEFQQSEGVTISGSGTGTLNIDIKCDQFEDATFDNDMFKMTTTVNKLNSIQTSLKTCLTYTPGNGTFTREMIILNVELQSGFVYDQSLNFGFPSFVKRKEPRKKNTMINFYLQELTGDGCFSFIMTRQYSISNLQKSFLRVYRYENYGKYAARSYNIDGTCT